MHVESQDRAKQRQADRLPLAVAALALAAAVCICGGWLFLKAARSLGEGVASAFKPAVSYTTILSGAVGRLQQESKLVVLRAEVSAEVVKESQKIQPLFGYNLDLGTTTVRVRARENRVQFFIPLGRVNENSFEYRPQERLLVFRSPSPMIDTDLVEVQSDPAKIDVETQVGWARLDAHSGQFLRDEAKRALRPAVLEVASSDWMVDKAKTATKEALKPMLHAVAGALRDGVELKVEFEQVERGK